MNIVTLPDNGLAARKAAADRIIAEQNKVLAHVYAQLDEARKLIEEASTLIRGD